MSTPKKGYYLGIDIGTNSVGAAACDKQYRVMKIAGKPALSVRLFEECKTAVERRGFRTAHRRIKRRALRLLWLKELLTEEMQKTDRSFFYRLANSDLDADDKSSAENPHPTDGKFSLFNDPDYTDADYLTEYPTIYHLRKAWMEGKVPNDSRAFRKFCLAVHHIIKYRGNFLREDEEFGSTPPFADVRQVWNDAVAAVNEAEAENANRKPLTEITATDESAAAEILNFKGAIFERYAQTERSRSAARKKAFAEWLGLRDKAYENWIKFMLGDSVDAEQLFGKGIYDKSAFEPQKAVAGEPETWFDKWSEVLSETDIQALAAAMEVYKWQTLVTLLNGKPYLSDAMIEKYEKHGSDKRKLKEYLRDCGSKEIHDSIFKEAHKGKKIVANYAAYVKKDSGKKVQRAKTEDFYEFMGNALKDLPDDPRKAEILSDIDAKTFMPKLNATDNAVIPYQLNMAELELILANAEKYFPFLKTADEYGTVSDKIKSLLKFRIPYYVGPLQHAKNSPNGKGFGWLVRKEGKIRPWNFGEIVDLGSSGLEFIKRMTCKCTYLPKFDVLPKSSLLYGEYMVLNELNGLRVNDMPLPIAAKRELLEKVYKNPETVGSVTVKKIKNFLTAGQKGELKITGFDSEIKADMKSYRFFRRILGDRLDDPKVYAAAEKYIELRTVFEKGTDAAKYFEKSDEAALFTEEELGKMRAFTASGWGKLSAELLNLELTDRSGEINSVIDLLRNTEYNLMQILFSKVAGYDFESARKAVMGEEDVDVNYDALAEEYCSPSVRRSVWQTILVFREYVKELGVPERIFIEYAREDDQKKKGKTTVKRKEIVSAVYKSHRAQIEEIFGAGECRELEERLENLADLNEDKLYLYFMQCGKDIYTGEKIDFDALKTDYDIDHIIPQALKKDDSLDNRVLTLRSLNGKKSDTYPITTIPITDKARSLWKALRTGGFMSAEKYDRLTRTAPLTDEELEGFINRQLVETSQAVKLADKYIRMDIRQMAKAAGEDINCEIVASKAANVSEFRRQFRLTKTREINDLHHAHDAYLNIVVGNVLNEKFSHSAYWRQYLGDEESEKEGEKEKRFDTNAQKRSWMFSKAFKRRAYSDRGERECVWIPKYEYGRSAPNPDATIDIVERNLRITYLPVTKMELTKGGSFYGGQRTGRDDLKSGGIGIKSGLRNNVKKYGGYKDLTTSYFCLVEITASSRKKVKRDRYILPVLTYYDNIIKRGEMTLKEALIEANKTSIDAFGSVSPENIKIIVEKIKIQSVLEFEKEYVKPDGTRETARTRVRIAGKTGIKIKVHNANEAYFDAETSRYIKEIGVVLGKIGKKLSAEPGKQKSDEEKVAMRQRELEKLEADKERRMQMPENRKADIIKIDRAGNLKIYRKLADKLSRPPFILLNAFEKYAGQIVDGEETFINMEPIKQLDCLTNILKLFRCGTFKTSLSDIGGTNIIQGIVPSMRITDLTVYYVSQSVAGFREKRVLLNKAER